MKLPNRVVLKLNADWSPHQISPWQDCVPLLLEGTASIVNVTGKPEDEEIYRWQDGSPILIRSGPGEDGVTPRIVLTMPSVILLRDFVSYPKRRMMSPSRYNIMQRDLYTCQYCGDPDSIVTIDHVWPRSKGGLTTFSNCVAACHRCQQTKRDHTLEEMRHRFTWNGRPFRLMHVPSEVLQKGVARFVYRVGRNNLTWLRYIKGWREIAPRIGKSHLLEDFELVGDVFSE